MTVPKSFVDKKLLSTGEVAKRLNVHRGTVWHWIQIGMLRAERVTERYSGVRPEALAAFKKTYSQDVDSVRKGVSPAKAPASARKRRKTA